MTVEPWVIDRIRSAPPAGASVLDGVTPIVSFGDPMRARIATVAINPAPTAFTSKRKGPRGEAITSPLLDLSHFVADTTPELTADEAERVARACYGYFERGIPHKWFLPFERMLSHLGASYTDGTACHLDLVQWTTSVKWARVDPAARKQLVASDAGFLRQQLRASSVEVLLLDGATTSTEVSSALGVTLEPQNTVAKDSKGTHLVMSYGRLDDTEILSWNIPLWQPINNPARQALVAWVRDQLRQH